MDSYELSPGYSTKEIPGKCLKCLAEHELNNCLMVLLREEVDSGETLQKFEALISFLQSPELETLRDESERLLSDGKKVSVKIDIIDGKPEYKLIVE